MKKLIIVIIISFAMVLACKNITEKNVPTIEKPELIFPVTINVDGARSNNEIPLLSEFADDISYIKLNTPPSVFVQIINDVQISDENIFIHENQRVMVFDRDGNYIRTIGKNGRGPNEYVYLRSFCVVKNDEGKEELIFYTGPEGNVYRYNVNGDVIEKLFTYRFADYMDLINDKLLFSGFTTNTKNLPENITQFASTNFKGQIIDSRLLPIYNVSNWDQQNLLSPGNFRSYRFDDALLLYGYLEDTVFQVNGLGKIEPRYILEFGNYGIPIEKRYLRKPEGLINSSITFLSAPVETGNNVWLRFAFQKQGFLLRFDKTIQKAFTFLYEGEKEINANWGNNIKEFGIVNNIDGGPDFYPEWSAYDDSIQICISAKQVFDLKQELTPEYFQKREVKFSEKNDSLVKLINSLEETDDYVLIFVKLK